MNYSVPSAQTFQIIQGLLPPWGLLLARANKNAYDGFYLDGSSNSNALSGNTANSKTQYGYQDLSTGSGTRGTANTYTGDICMGNSIAGSTPSGRGAPQPWSIRASSPRVISNTIMIRKPAALSVLLKLGL